MPCATTLEAEVRELRLIAEHKPRYNRRSRFPERSPWVKLTVEPFPRLSIVREVAADGAAYLGPFGTQARRRAGRRSRCTRRSRCGSAPSGCPAAAAASACVLAEMGRCGAPCTRCPDRRDEYAGLVSQAIAAMTGDARAVVATLRARIGRWPAGERFEEAAVTATGCSPWSGPRARGQRLAPLAAAPELVAAAR